MFALSRDGLFFRSAARVSTGSTPTTALFITALVAIMLAGVGSFERLFGFTAFLSVLVDVAALARSLFCVGESLTFRDRLEHAAILCFQQSCFSGPVCC